MKRNIRSLLGYGRDAEEKETPVAGSRDVEELKKMIMSLSKKIDEMNK